MKTPKDSLHRTLFNELFPRTLSKSEQTKFAILEAAIKIYSELGIEYVSYEDIARKAKVTRPLVNHHFPDKRQLFELAIKYIRTQFQQLAVNAIQKEKSAMDQLKAYVISTVQWTRTSPAHAKTWVFFFYLSISDKELRTMHKQLTTMGMERLRVLLQMVAKENGFPIDNLNERAKIIQRNITGALLELATEYDSNDTVAYESICDQTIRYCVDVCAHKSA